jgi:hypothetical protein
LPFYAIARHYGAFFDDKQSLVDYVNSQRLVNPLVCLGDGHDGVWNLVKELGKSENFEGSIHFRRIDFFR